MEIALYELATMSITDAILSAFTFRLIAYDAQRWMCSKAADAPVMESGLSVKNWLVSQRGRANIFLYKCDITSLDETREQGFDVPEVDT